MTQHNGVSRRSFLGAGLAAAAAAAANVAQAAPRATEVDSWDEEFDMIVVGSGFAGLSACYEAQRLGLKKIVVLEKMEAFGGNSALCGGLMCMPLTKLQKANGIKDDPELLVKDMFKAGRGFNHPQLARTLAENAYKAYDMMQACGVKLKDKVIRLGTFLSMLRAAVWWFRFTSICAARVLNSAIESMSRNSSSRPKVAKV